jgi:biotin transport system substrate-specific component
MQTTLPLSIGTLRNKDLFRTLPGRAVLAVAASVFVAFCAHLSVPLPFTPVPLTLSNFAVLLVGLALDPATAFVAMVLFLAEGAAGLPVFSQYGAGGLAQLTGFTGGYLLAYPIAAALASFVVRKAPARISRFASAVVGCTLATIVIFAFGVGWLGHLRHVDAAPLFYLAVAPFLPGEVVKIAAASGIYTTLRARPRS